MYRKLLTILLSATLAGCAWNVLDKDFATPPSKLAPPKLHLLSMGMGKQQVIQVLGHPDQFNGVRRDGANVVEIWEYHRMRAMPGPDVIAERYGLEFTNGQLSRYESAGPEQQ